MAGSAFSSLLNEEIGTQLAFAMQQTTPKLKATRLTFHAFLGLQGASAGLAWTQNAGCWQVIGLEGRRRPLLSIWQLMPDVGSALLFPTWLLQSSRLASSHCGLKEVFQEGGDRNHRALGTYTMLRPLHSISQSRSQTS